MKDNTDRENAVKKITDYILRKYYCEGNVDAVIQLLDEELGWLGAGESEFEIGRKKTEERLRSFSGMVPKCMISREEYYVQELGIDYYLCFGRFWVETDPATQIFLRQHQRFSMVWRWTQKQFRCCHIHLSNPYMEMQENDIGFPTQISQQSYEYMQEQLEHQKKQIEQQLHILNEMSYLDSMTGVYNRNKLNQIESYYTESSHQGSLGVACFDLNNLKKINDEYGHIAGDMHICKMVEHLKRFFEEKIFRMGGDEFLVIDPETKKETFFQQIESVKKSMQEDQISCAVGISWKEAGNIREQYGEADRLMYQGKAEFRRRNAENQERKQN